LTGVRGPLGEYAGRSDVGVDIHLLRESHDDADGVHVDIE